MPTKTRSATGNASDAKITEPPAKGAGRKTATTIRAARDPLKPAAGEAKLKSPQVAEAQATAGVAPKGAGKRMVSIASTSVDDPETTKATDPQRIDPAASRKAAAAFVAARRKMAPAATPVSPVNSSDASKGTVSVSDNIVGKTTLDNSAPETAAPAPVAVAPVPVMPQRPFSAVQRGPAAMKPRPAPSAKGQTFKTGEFIVYPAHGVGQITAVESQEVAGYKLELFVISFVKDKMILKVPLPKISSVGMRKLAEPPVMKRALDTLTGRARVKRTMWSRRAQEYEAKINSGDLIAIAEVVRDLYRSDAQPEQSYSERQLYEAALDRMARELGVVQKLTDTEALKIIDDQLQKGPRRGKADEAEDAEADESDEGGIGEAA